MSLLSSLGGWVDNGVGDVLVLIHLAHLHLHLHIVTLFTENWDNATLQITTHTNIDIDTVNKMPMLYSRQASLSACVAGWYVPSNPLPRLDSVIFLSSNRASCETNES